MEPKQKTGRHSGSDALHEVILHGRRRNKANLKKNWKTDWQTASTQFHVLHTTRVFPL